ncbi:hypothetical protein BOQ54_03085 [Chelatococcus daeguensis]|uniref:Uncharacterized protein n=1 Tax=Chelatococcus daeguensis TaxID=444444 RepID=A0AAC9JMI1_9HYPH|nr:hypothetical protein [Chelatococcus daeguensis]APF36423.1 hypothetical protein BOQ54_03085 [Chelatococcus daeguensis]
MAEPRNRPPLNLDAFKPTPVADPAPARQVAEELGFTTREGAVAVADARMYRRPTPRTAQLNVAIRPAVKERFWKLAYELEVASGEELLIRLLDAYDLQSRAREAVE